MNHQATSFCAFLGRPENKLNMAYTEMENFD